MTSTPVQVLQGVYLGLLAGVIPALVAFAFGFLFRYVTGLSIPAFGVVVLGVALAGVNGGLLAFADPTITQAANSTTLVVALLVVVLVTFYMHAVGDRLGATLPRRISLRSLRERTLHADVVNLVGGRGEVTVRVVGAVRDVEGYPPLSDALRTEIRDVEWRFPADVPLSELETRFQDRLHSEFDVEEASVTLDQRARASVAAAPPAAGVSKRTPTGTRAVSVDALVPTGVARGDEVSVLAGDDRVNGTVVSARSGGTGSRPPSPPARTAGEGTDDRSEYAPSRETAFAPDRETTPAPTTMGGTGRITVAVSRPDAERLLASDGARVVVSSRGTRREYELLGVLRRAGQRVRRVALREDSPLVAGSVSAAGVRDEYGVAVLAVRNGDSWTFAPAADATLAGEVFVAGPREALDRFAEVAT